MTYYFPATITPGLYRAMKSSRHLYRKRVTRFAGRTFTGYVLKPEYRHLAHPDDNRR